MSKAEDSSRSAPDDEVVTYPFGPPDPPPPMPRRGRGVATAGVALVLVALAVGAIVFVRSLRQNDGLAVGDCAAFRPGASELFREADCADEAAEYVLLAVTQEGECQDVPGATRSMILDNTELCFGNKGVDPATAVNGAREGDCVIMAGDVVQRTPCTSSAATHEVTRRVTDVPAAEAEELCGGADMRYGWDWSNVQTGREPTQYDVLLCLTSL